MPRNTGTGAILEDTIIPSLRRNGYTFVKQYNVGNTMAGGKHIADIVVDLDATSKAIVSLKWQQSEGTAKEKVPFEIIKLIHAVQTSNNTFPYDTLC